MGACCSCQVSIVGKVHDVESEGSQMDNSDITCEHGGDQIMLKGSKFVSMYNQKGTKEINQDALTVWEVTFLMFLFPDFMSFMLFFVSFHY